MTAFEGPDDETDAFDDAEFDAASAADDVTGEPDDAVKTLLDRAHAAGDEGDFDTMATLLRDGLADHPGDPFVLCWLGVAERELGMEGIAYERFRACLAAQPTDPGLLATAGRTIPRPKARCGPRPSSRPTCPSPGGCTAPTSSARG